MALQVAADSLERYADGVWLVELASLADPAFVPHSVAAALDVPEQPTRPLTETLANYLRTKKMLLLLDGCEHLRAAWQSLTDHLLRAGDAVRILATSREALGLEGEVTYRVPSLRLPDGQHVPSAAQLAEYDAIRLFVERAALAQLGFALTEGNAQAIVQICQRLDGMPLAIEFAAARARMLSVEQIAARLHDRFRLLTAGTRQTLPRQQTLRATTDWSYDLLSDPERALLRRLSVFAGGWPFEAAEMVCAGGGVEAVDILDLLRQLVDKSLIIVETHGGEARYRLLETVRQYGDEKLRNAGEAAEVGRRHRDWFLALAEQAGSELRGPKRSIWLDRLETEHDNLRAAHEWTMAEACGREEGLRLAAALTYFSSQRGHWREGYQWLEEGLTSSGAVAPATLAKALAGSALFAVWLGKYARAIALAEEGVALCREVADRGNGALCLHWLGNVAMQHGDYERAKRFQRESLSLCSGLEDKFPASLALLDLGAVARLEGDYEQAITFHEQCLAMARDGGNVPPLGTVLGHLGMDNLRRGDYGRAAEHYKQSLSVCKEVGNRWIPVECLSGFGDLACVAQQYERAARLFGAANQLGEAVGLRSNPSDQECHDHYTAAARAGLGEAAFAAAWAEGRAMRLEQAIEYALAWGGPGEPAGPRRRATRPEGEVLTAREREVAALVARGQTNREIATTLVISERTADAHVQNILNKLDFSSRAQIAAWAAEHGLRTDLGARTARSNATHHPPQPRQGT